MSRKHRKSRGSCIGDGCEGACDVLDIFSITNVVALTTGFVALQGTDVPTGGSSASRLLRRMVRAYQLRISPQRPACCRLTPTCSRYATEALAGHGAVKGSLLAARRLHRCRPGGPTGSDPVPGT